MKTFNTISLLLVLVAACTVLSSCSLLVASPIHSSRYYHPQDGNGDRLAYQGFYNIPSKGGIYEFECSTDQFYISNILDSSMSRHRPNSRYNEDDYEPVDDTVYYGSFYTITCNYEKNTWVIEVDPFPATYGRFGKREVWVTMWKENDEGDGELLSFHFLQGSSK